MVRSAIEASGDFGRVVCAGGMRWLAESSLTKREKWLFVSELLLRACAVPESFVDEWWHGNRQRRNLQTCVQQQPGVQASVKCAICLENCSPKMMIVHKPDADYPPHDGFCADCASKLLPFGVRGTRRHLRTCPLCCRGLRRDAMRPGELIEGGVTEQDHTAQSQIAYLAHRLKGCIS
jgi:hypothetical protein